MMRTCSHCGAEKPIADYYAHPLGAGGRMTICKECHKARVRQNRAANIDRYREYDRERADHPKRVSARMAYAEMCKKSPHLRSATNKYKREWLMRHSEKRRAHVITGNAIRDGILTRQPCERCGALRVEAHHEDYYKPLDVTWLCKPCHMMRHREINRKKREAA